MDSPTASSAQESPKGLSTLTQDEALRLFAAGDLVTPHDMENRAEEDGRYCLWEKELVTPTSFVREDGLPFIHVEGQEGIFFRPTQVFLFMEDYLRMSPDEEAEFEAERLAEETEAAAREAKIRWDLDHPKPETVASSMNICCGISLTMIEKGLRHRSEKVRRTAMHQARNIQRAAKRILVGEDWDRPGYFA